VLDVSGVPMEKECDFNTLNEESSVRTRGQWKRTSTSYLFPHLSDPIVSRGHRGPPEGAGLKGRQRGVAGKSGSDSGPRAYKMSLTTVESTLFVLYRRTYSL
jgi:hypothetical protein